MSLRRIGWLLICLEVLILLIWFCLLWFTDLSNPDTQKTSIAYTLLLVGYISVNVVLMVLRSKGATIAAIIMAGFPVFSSFYGMLHYLMS